MGLHYRKSVKLDLFRVSIGKSALGFSVGGLCFRDSKSSRGPKYNNSSISGTGVGYRKYASSCVVFLAGIQG